MPFKTLRRSLLLLATIAGAPAAAQVAPAPLTLVGEAGATKALTLAELAALPQADVVVRESDSSAVIFRGPTLRTLITLVGAPTGHALRGPSMLLAVLAEAADGYQVAYMLAELDDQFGARLAILALTQDGQPLPERDGPLRVVIAGEPHHARWIRQVLRLRLVRVGAAPPGQQPNTDLEPSGARRPGACTSASAAAAEKEH